MKESPDYSIPTIQITAPNGEVLSVLIEWNGDQSLSLVCREAIDENLHAVIRAIWQVLQTPPIPGIIDIIPTFHSITLVFDPLTITNTHNYPTAGEVILQQVMSRLNQLTIPASTLKRQVSIPVCYDTSLAPDLITLSERLAISPEELVTLHHSKPYSVYMLGFLPGFAYMGILDASITAPRHPRPRPRVPAGSVAIAAQQTGIYPTDSPGGWQLIGRTPVRMFNPLEPNPCVLQPGDEVTFYPVSVKEYHQLMPQ
jgi:inhibitor of KinA